MTSKVAESCSRFAEIFGRPDPCVLVVEGVTAVVVDVVVVVVAVVVAVVVVVVVVVPR